MFVFGGKTKKIFWGLFFIFAAAFAIISPMGIFGEIGVWSIIFTVFSLAMLIDGIANFSYFKILMSLAFLCIIYADLLNIQHLTPWPVLGAAFLLSIGLSIMFGKRSPWFIFHPFGGHKNQYNTKNFGGDVADHYDDNDNVECSVAMGSSSKYLHSTSLKSAYLSCHMGTLNVFFDNVTLHPEGAVVKVDCTMGDINLYFPKGWVVNNEISSFLADIEEVNNRNRETSGAVVRLTGNVNMGDVEIIYV